MRKEEAEVVISYLLPLTSYLSPLTTHHLKLRNMKKETWKTILQIIASIISSIITAMSTTSCMGYGPF